MKFTKPESLWQWSLLMSPAVINLVGAVTAAAANQGRGSETRGYAVLGSGIITMCIGAVICLALGYWLVRKSDHWGWKVLGTIGCGAVLAIVNAAIGFAGCMLVAG